MEILYQQADNFQFSIFQFFNLSTGSRRGLYSSIAFTLNLIALACASSCSFSAMHTTALPILLIPEITDHIVVTLAPNEEVSAAIEAYGELVKSQVLANDIIIAANDGNEVEFDDFKLNIKIEKN